VKQAIRLIAVMVLTGCATSFSVLDATLPTLKGREIGEAVRYLGVPSQEYEIVGKKVYVWSTSMAYVTSGATTSSTTGAVGTTPFRATTTTFGAGTATQLSCTLKLVTANGLIEDYDYDGNNGACFRYSDRLKPLAR
jgi:hypothetical protein